MVFDAYSQTVQYLKNKSTQVSEVQVKQNVIILNI